MEGLDQPPNRPPPPPPQRSVRPKITLQIPDSNVVQKAPPTGPPVWGPRYPTTPRAPVTPGSHISGPQSTPYTINPFLYQTKASEFMFKQFAGFKDFTMNTAKSGLSAGEKSAFWFYNKLRTLSKKWFTHIFLLLCLVLYSAMGAGIFVALEGDRKVPDLNVVRMNTARQLHNEVTSNESLIQDKEKFIDKTIELLMSYETQFTESQKREWGFVNAMFYAGTIYTTIGYGHIYPTTTYGRAATIVYAVIGIPLFLIVLADFGKLFTRIIKFFWAFVRRFYYTRSCRKVRRTVPVQEVMKGLNIVYDVVRRPSQLMFEDEENDIKPKDGPSEPPALERKPSADIPPPLPPKPGTLPRDIESATEPDTPAPSVFEIDDEFNLPISVAIIVLILYILAGAVLFCLREGWSFFDSFYFVFISMSTIGLGDLAPNHPIFMMSSILYLVFGLALTSMCINVVQVKLSDTFKQASAKLGATIGLKVAEEDGSLVPMTPPPMEIAPVHKPKKPEDSPEASKSKENEVDVLESKNK